MLWAAIHLPHRALDAVLRRRPGPQAALALVSGPAQRRVLVQANAAALAAGVRPGQALATALSIHPALAVEEYDGAEAARGRPALGADRGAG